MKIAFGADMDPLDPTQFDDIICPCSGTKRGDIVDLHAQGKDLDAISRWTGAVSGCGGCEWDIAEMLAALEKTQN